MITCLASLMFLAVFLAIWWLGRHRAAAHDALDRRLEGLERPNEARDGSILAGLEQLLESRPLLALLRPRSELARQRLQLQLTRAGLRSPAAPAIYLASQLILGTAGAVGGALFGLVMRAGWQSALFAILGGVIGGALPHTAVQWRQRRRLDEVRKSLPDVLDLLVIALECGRTVDAALRETLEDIGRLSPLLAGEFALYFHQLELGVKRRIAWEELGLRGGEEMAGLAATLIQTHQLGSGIAAPLEELSTRMRVRRRQKAEERAQLAALKILFVLLLLIFPGIFVVLVGPAALAIMREILALG